MTTTPMDCAVTFVGNGVSWLDEHEPDWPEFVELEILDMQSETRCVAGQIARRVGIPGYFSYLEARVSPHDIEAAEDPLGGDLIEEGAWGVSHGFDTNLLDPRYPTFDMLEKQWRQVITERRVTGPSHA